LQLDLFNKINAQTSCSNSACQNQRVEIWLQTAVTAPDQLRQKLAWVLSQIFVVSDTNSSLSPFAQQVAAFSDILARDSLGETGNIFQNSSSGQVGTFERLLADVTQSPAMGSMLSFTRNLPANTKTGTSPDENYAREVMQLFTIGLIRRNPNFSPVMVGGATVPTYTQDVVSTNAKIFTGLSYQGGFYTSPANPVVPALYEPLVCYEKYHDESAKTLIGGSTTSGGSNSCQNDIPAIITALARHPNTAPFISRQLIERLTSSNPSPAYIRRVVAVFENNGRGVYGDLAAVTQAILLDPEVGRHPATGSVYPVFGKAREPLLKPIALWRYYHASSQTPTYSVPNPEQAYAQAPMRSPSVFNFDNPDYFPQGEMSDRQLYGPEFQIINASTLFSAANDLANRVNAYVGNTHNTTQTIAIDLSSLFALAGNPSALIAQINHDLMYGSMSNFMTMRLITMEMQLAKSDVPTRVVSALQVVLASPEFAVQR
jgi:uncharacterized protein (DUF1800 family)